MKDELLRIVLKLVLDHKDSVLALSKRSDVKVSGTVLDGLLKRDNELLSVIGALPRTKWVSVKDAMPSEEDIKNSKGVFYALSIHSTVEKVKLNRGSWYCLTRSSTGDSCENQAMLGIDSDFIVAWRVIDDFTTSPALDLFLSCALSHHTSSIDVAVASLGVPTERAILDTANTIRLGREALSLINSKGWTLCADKLPSQEDILSSNLWCDVILENLEVTRLRFDHGDWCVIKTRGYSFFSDCADYSKVIAWKKER